MNHQQVCMCLHGWLWVGTNIVHFLQHNVIVSDVYCDKQLLDDKMTVWKWPIKPRIDFFGTFEWLHGSHSTNIYHSALLIITDFWYVFVMELTFHGYNIDVCWDLFY